ncbi:MAG: TerB N-terminal domain-containing protein [Planctomycetes bacterium]|nr:TerB N-terminal domain-containing protein [Planctomycetota bacterium]
MYLRWLASGRNVLPPGDGYLFVHYYGLERRAIVDRTDTTATSH